MVNEMTPWKMVAEAQRRADIKVIQDQMFKWGHKFAPGCVCCITARGLIEAIEESAEKPAASDDGVVVTVYEEGEK